METARIGPQNGTSSVSGLKEDADIGLAVNAWVGVAVALSSPDCERTTRI